MNQPTPIERRILVTPEALPLFLTLASVGSRIKAFLLDLLFLTLGLLACLLFVTLISALLKPESEIPFVIVVILIFFFISNGYFLFFELYWQGSTPGKRLFGLRVVSCDGGPLSTGAVFSRNLMRELEFWLPMKILLVPQAMYPQAPVGIAWAASGWVFVFLLMPLLNRDRLRTGDLVAGTMVVTRPEGRLLPDPADTTLAQESEIQFGFTNEQLDMYGIKELQVLEQLLQKDTHHPSQWPLLDAVCLKIQGKIGWTTPIPSRSVLNFLHAFYRAQRRRLESRLLMGERREKKKLGKLKQR